MHCTKQDDEARNAAAWAYPDASIRLRKAYASNQRWQIAQVQLEGYRCDGPPDPAFWYQWFAVAPDQQVRFLDTSGWLIDAGDYDNDGRSELVFAVGGYNRDGYRLFYDDFKRSATFEFSYH